MKKLLTLFTFILAALLLTSCNAAKNVQNNIVQDADNFQTYRKITVVNLIHETIMMEIEGYFSTQNTTSTDGLAIVIKVGPKEYKMHYIYSSTNIVTIVEQLENTSTDPYHWKIKVFAMYPKFEGAE